jgi:hypothetical protein
MVIDDIGEQFCTARRWPEFVGLSPFQIVQNSVAWLTVNKLLYFVLLTECFKSPELQKNTVITNMLGCQQRTALK